MRMLPFFPSFQVGIVLLVKNVMPCGSGWMESVYMRL
jgi:hypothetical protein